MSGTDNKAILQRGFAMMNTHDLAGFATLLAPNYVNYSFPDTHGPEGFVQVLGMFFAAFPDMQVTVEDSIAEGEKVATRGFFTGTHRGEFMGIPATGKTIHIGYSDIWRFENGKAVENWVQMDMLGMMQQLGVAPAPTQQT